MSEEKLERLVFLFIEEKMEGNTAKIHKITKVDKVHVG